MRNAADEFERSRPPDGDFFQIYPLPYSGELFLQQLGNHLIQLCRMLHRSIDLCGTCFMIVSLPSRLPALSYPWARSKSLERISLASWRKFLAMTSSSCTEGWDPWRSSVDPLTC